MRNKSMVVSHLWLKRLDQGNLPDKPASYGLWLTETSNWIPLVNGFSTPGVEVPCLTYTWSSLASTCPCRSSGLARKGHQQIRHSSAGSGCGLRTGVHAQRSACSGTHAAVSAHHKTSRRRAFARMGSLYLAYDATAHSLVELVSMEEWVNLGSGSGLTMVEWEWTSGTLVESQAVAVYEEMMRRTRWMALLEVVHRSLGFQTASGHDPQ